MTTGGSTLGAVVQALNAAKASAASTDRARKPICEKSLEALCSHGCLLAVSSQTKQEFVGVLKIIGRIAMVLAVIVVAAILAGQAGLLRGHMPPDLGVKAGRLKPPSLTPNSVSSQADWYPDHPQRAYAAIAPLHYAGDGHVAMQRLVEILNGMARTAIIRKDSTYVYAQCSTPLMRFTDDVEFWLDEPNSVIQVRSASRLGAKDFGVNRRRIEEIRAQFQQN